MNIIHKNANLEMTNFSFPYTYSERSPFSIPLELFVNGVNEKYGIRIMQAQVMLSPSRKEVYFHLLERGISCKRNMGTILGLNMRMDAFSCNICPFIPELIKLLHDSLIESGLYCEYANMEYDFASFTLIDYDAVMRIAFFESDYFVQLEKSIKERYSFCDFILRWKEDESYYLIFKNNADLDNKSLIHSIIEDTNKRLLEMDFLHVFSNCNPIAIITSYDRLQQEGAIMGIMRNNTRFDSFF